MGLGKLVERLVVLLTGGKVRIPDVTLTVDPVVVVSSVTEPAMTRTMPLNRKTEGLLDALGLLVD